MMTEVKSNLIHEWSKSSTFKQVSSFGSGPKDAHRRAIVDDGFDAIRSSLDWVAYDSNNNHHGRFRIESALGKLLNTPGKWCLECVPTDTDSMIPMANNAGAGHYDPKIDFQAKRENTPLITIANRRYDRYFDDLADLKRSQSALLLKQNPADKIRSEQIRSYKVRQGQFSNVNIDAIRLSMLPGPGSYDGKPELVERFHRPPMPRLRPRQPIAVPRKKIMVATLDIIDTPSQREPEGKKTSSSPQSCVSGAYLWNI